MEVRLFYLESGKKISDEFKQAQARGKDYLPYNISLMGAPYLWPETRGEGTVIAILDTGIDTDHPDLKNRIIGGRNFTSDYHGDVKNYQDNHYHGTHVAGIIAGSLNQQGIVGVAPEAKLFIGKVISGNGRGDMIWLIRAIHYCLRWSGPDGEKVNIINISLGSGSYHKGLHKVIKKAVREDVTVIVAAGNERGEITPSNEISFPAFFPEVISVGAVDFNKKIAHFSHSNKAVDVSGPGVDILSTIPGGNYGILDGTSMACPHISGFAALLRGKFFRRFHRYPTEKELFTILKMLTTDMADAGIEAATGAGFVTVLLDQPFEL